MDTTIDWQLYRSFLAALREGSLSAAARALGLAQPTLGRHIDALETALGIALFTRSQGGLLPTEAALALRPHAEAMASHAAALERVATRQGGEPRGTVRVTASEVVGVEVLPAALAGLRRRHPEIAIELVLSNRAQDLLLREADIAVRMTPPQQAQLIARPVGAIEIGLFAAPAYLAEHGEPAAIEDLDHHCLIGFDRPTAFQREAAKRMPGLTREGFGLRSDSDLVQLALLRAGAGIGFCQLPLARRDGLRRILPEHYALRLDTWITMHEDLRHNPACKAVFGALVEGMRRHAGDVSSGGCPP
ncbi:LysR family transcriptional regulator [Chromobacterium violaceum]|uniref:LysR family transcriptional regulator n=1 Tax=Chromobacterium violaceum TaxID=536 RepID=UPI0009D9E248|nr:LysR family transcriptional regulator [Chromobacterium violaceum]MBP4050181.1 LysR family transcriptional regulator [Chromobacterium violaceum]OQS28060.1 LysR family transcriptional regulator [Chromobacterium violaceum]OQS51134.1 LysR family transcriptional regulator [Chromobacterium violaceum]OQS53137.1 LysR family transcriptional regulator [Chromobacterium violaceum]QRO34588.1 LysR family transcriptional regulator [Chromobacterium violaceum]